MKRLLLLLVLAILLPSAPPSIASMGATSLFAAGSSPSTVSAALAKAIAEDPSLSPDLVLEVVDAYARSMSGEDLEQAVEQIFNALAASSPESLITALSAVCAKYPNLALSAARGAASGAPNMARYIAEAVYASAPAIDADTLASAIATAASLEQSLVFEWLSNPLGWSSIPASAFPGSGGSSRPEPYAN